MRISVGGGLGPVRLSQTVYRSKRRSSSTLGSALIEVLVAGLGVCFRAVEWVLLTAAIFTVDCVTRCRGRSRQL
jgi:hypothetical protein